MRNRIYICSLLVLLVLYLASCQSLDEKLTKKTRIQDIPNSEESLTIESNKERYKVPVKKVVLVINNATNMDTDFNQFATIEKKKSGDWYPVPIKAGQSIDAAGRALNANRESNVTFPLEHLDEELDPGQYRIVVGFSHKESSFQLATPFEVVEN
ncbi:hypothetical protein SAMN05518871_1106 [Psychrobacillus sp. OK028]|uniref:immunoglobulin-like domain-containing protein n=1 Tax=Psychrobacillus sp. OK028 TaxID=1884359 RepID=UPI00088DA53A|nr:immunoglobulin-like domain-containing protein [Psychrobacillus sp. OK028]SDO07979.1 hypothetical protein SAMN05518871_1106 [Psychrobacillus sp. OK028]